MIDLPGGIQAYHGDFRKVLASVPDASIDCIVTDPPYGQTSLQWDRWVSGWPDVVARVLKPTGSMWVFGTLRMFMDQREDFARWRFAQDIVWEKHNGSSLQNDRFRRVHEQAVQFYQGSWADVFKGKVVMLDETARTVRRKTRPQHWGGIGDATYESKDGGPRIMRSVIYARSQHGKAIHPTQKPEAIIEPLILNACPPGGIVLDVFAGSGTTGAVAARLGRRSILIEANETYFAALLDRFQGALL